MQTPNTAAGQCTDQVMVALRGAGFFKKTAEYNRAWSLVLGALEKELGQVEVPKYGMALKGSGIAESQRYVELYRTSVTPVSDPNCKCYCGSGKKYKYCHGL